MKAPAKRKQAQRPSRSSSAKAGGTAGPKYGSAKSSVSRQSMKRATAVAPRHDAGAPKAPVSCEALVDRLLASYQTGPVWMHHLGGLDLPQMAEVVACIDETRALLFPGFIGDVHVGASRADVHAYICKRLADLERRIGVQIYRGLHQRCRVSSGGRDSGRSGCAKCTPAAAAIADRFLQALPEIRQKLSADVDAAFEGDPAATGIDEIILSYPGLFATTCYRLAHELLLAGAPTVPRMISEYAHERTGIDIHPGAKIGGSFFIDHGTGAVIGETSVIGDRVRLYQGVTLGALSLPRGRAREKATVKRHPTIENDVIIYAGATILGGDTVIGEGAVIGGNCWVTKSVPKGARVTLATSDAARR